MKNPEKAQHQNFLNAVYNATANAKSVQNGNHPEKMYSRRKLRTPQRMTKINQFVRNKFFRFYNWNIVSSFAAFNLKFVQIQDIGIVKHIFLPVKHVFPYMHAYVNIFLKKMIFSAQNAILCIPPNFKQSERNLNMIKKYSEEKRKAVIEARKAGLTIAQIAVQTGVGRTTIKAC